MLKQKTALGLGSEGDGCCGFKTPIRSFARGSYGLPELPRREREWLSCTTVSGSRVPWATIF